jgi:hypothetical protein
MKMKAQDHLDLKAKNQEVLGAKYNNINNPALKSFQVFKHKIMEDKEEIKKLKPGAKQKINEIVKLESSVKYRLTRHFVNRLDIFSRFWFPIIYILWFNSALYQLDENIPRFVILLLIDITMIISYCVMKIFEVRNRYHLSFWQAVRYYMKGNCCRLGKTVNLA